MSMRRHILIVAVVSMVGALVGGAGVAIAAHQFDDVGDSNFFHGAIGQIVEAGCATGFPDDTFRPSNGATRGQFAFWTTNCSSRVAHGDGTVTLSPDVDVLVSTPIVPPSSNESGFIVVMVDWSAAPTAPELAALDLRDDAGIRLVGASPPCPCRVAALHEVDHVGEGLVGRTQDVWLGVPGALTVDDLMVLNGSATFVIPAGPDAPVDFDTTFTYQATSPAFAGTVDLTYHITLLTVPFGWDGSQRFLPAE
jgi:hypothetical protein